MGANGFQDCTGGEGSREARGTEGAPVPEGQWGAGRSEKTQSREKGGSVSETLCLKSPLMTLA